VALAWSIFYAKYYLLFADLLVVIAIQVYLLVRYLNSVNRELEMFFTSLENNDISISSIAVKKGISYQNLVNRMNSLKQKIDNLRLENARQYQYLKAIVENIGIGVLVCNSGGKIELVNTAGKKILGISNQSNIQQLDLHFENLSEQLLKVASGQQILLRLNIGNNFVPVSFKISDYRFSEHTLKLISFQNIKNELDAQELESWQKLIRVLTHEIMNSTGPITSSIDSIREFLVDEETHEIKKIDTNILRDVVRGIDIIKERSIGLSEFVRNFKSLTTKPEIKPEKIPIQELFEHIRFLLTEELISRKIEIKIAVHPLTLEFLADKNLIGQVLMNLIYNSIEALEGLENKIIQLKSFKNLDNKIVIQVIDNGKGIPDELKDKIFIPFFTTREKGSGIGLSLARQIMQLHQGLISVISVPDKETIFELRFNT
jgi:nitrogen fixation/metabolism regulation signal transduction histidine kinase